MDKKLYIANDRFKFNNKKLEKVSFSHNYRPYNIVRPHWHDFFEIELVIGKGSTVIDGVTYTFEKGAIFFLSPAAIHSIEFENSGFECYNFNFDITFFDSENLISLLAESDYSFMPLYEKDIEYYTRILSDCQSEFEKTNPLSLLYSQKVLEFFVVDVIKNGFTVQSGYSAYNNSNSSIQKAVLYIKKNFKKNISAADVAEAVWLSEKYFSRLFHQKMGCTLSNYITNMRLKNACYLLTHVGDNIESIAHDSGFNDSKYFMKTFKKYYGITPSEYRKEHTM